MIRSVVSIVGAAALALALPPTLSAQQADVEVGVQGDTVRLYELEGVEVSVTRSPRLLEHATQKIELIGPAEIARTPATEFTDLLKKQSAVDVIQFPGLLSGVSIRGFRPQYSGINPRTLILIDGRPAGANNLSTIDLSLVERVEILRGPAAALYGSSAMAGAVNVITRRSTGALGGRVTLGYGSFDSYRAEVAVGGTLAGGVDFDLSLSGFDQRGGFRTGSNRLAGGNEVIKQLDAGGEMVLPEFTRDTLLQHSEHGYRSGRIRLGYALSPAWRIDVGGNAFLAERVQNPGDLHAGYDGRSLKDVDRNGVDVSLGGTHGRHNLLARGYRTSERVRYYNQPLGDVFVNLTTPTTWTGVQLQDAIGLGAHGLVMGFDHARASAHSKRYLEPSERGAPWSPNSSITSSAIFSEGRISLLDERFIATLGGRLDHVTFQVQETPYLDGYAANRETHTEFNPTAGLRYNAVGGFSLRASAGRAFVTPDAFNVAGYAETGAGDRAVNVMRGNPDLRPESSLSWDAGVEVTRPTAGFQAELTYFSTDVQNRITAVGLPGSGALTPGGDTIRSISTYENVDEATIRGLEASIVYDLSALTGASHALRLSASGSRILTAEQTTGGVTGPILNVAKLNLNGALEFDDLRRFSARLGGRYVGERQDQDFSDWMNPGIITFPSFLVLDLSGDLRVGDRYRLGARIENLTDENYYEVRGYPLPGRALRLQLGVEF